MKTSYEYLTKTATKPAASWSNRDRVTFECFNPNGLLARKRANDDRIAELVDAGVVPSGWHLAYGGFDSSRVNAFYDLLSKRRVDRIRLEVAIELLTEQVNKVAAKCEGVSA